MRAVNFENIPREMIEYPQWVCWKAVPKGDGRFDKVPVEPGTGRNAKSNDPATWRTYLEAVGFYEKHRKKYAGIGFVLSEADPFTGGDIDHCRDPETGKLTDRARAILQHFNTYSEISPSDTGVRFFCRGELPGPGIAKDGIELYSKGRFLTITGGWIGDYSGNIEDRAKEILELHKELRGSNGTGVNPGENEKGWQDELLLGVGTGARHHAAVRLACRWAALGASQAEITTLLTSWNDRNRPVKPELSDPTSKEFKDILDYAKDNAFSNPRAENTKSQQKTEPKEVASSFPAHVMTKVAGDFAKLYSSYLESPPEFFYIAFLTCLGSVLSGRVTLESELKPQPRLYTLILGQSADDRKSTALSKTVEFFRHTLTDFQTSWGIGSAEGLQKRFESHNNVLLCLDEFKQFVSKCKIQSSVLLQCTTTLFELNRYENRTRKGNIELHNAHLSMLAASTLQTYEGCWDTQFTDIGFNNRLFLVPGTAMKRFSFPAKIPDTEKRHLRKRLQELLSFCGANGWEIPIAPEARDLYHKWYIGQETGSIHTKRLDTYAMRLMVLLTVNSIEGTVSPEIVQSVIDLCDWQRQMRQQHDPVDADSVAAKLEEKIRRVLANSPQSDRDLKRHTNAHRAGLWFFNSAKKNLLASGEIRFDKKTNKWLSI
jgi:hypothetical protein